VCVGGAQQNLHNFGDGNVFRFWVPLWSFFYNLAGEIVN